MKKLLLLVPVLLVLSSCGEKAITPVVAPTTTIPVTTTGEGVDIVTTNDYSFIPDQQPSITGTREQNNIVLWKHLKDSSNRFYIQNSGTVSIWLAESLDCNRDILIGINGKSMGVLHKNNNCEFISDTMRNSGGTFAFLLSSIEIVQNGQTKTLNLFQYMNDEGYLELSFAVGQRDNYVTIIEVE